MPTPDEPRRPQVAPAPADAAEAVLAAYERWADGFAEITRRAPRRFRARDWRGAQADAAERLTLYGAAVDDCVAGLRGRLSAADAEQARERFAARVQGRPDGELAQTFFSSVVRRVLGTVGVDARTEFTADADPRDLAPAPVHAHPAAGAGPALFEAVFRATELADAFADLPGDAALCARALQAQLGADAARVRAAEMLPALFYRNKGVYLVGRLRLDGGEACPLVVPLLHPPEGVRPDAVLTDEDDVSVVFSFARSYFHVDVREPGAAVAFLRSLMPAKPPHELYISLGFNRHGKTELYRALRHLLAQPDTRFELAEGARGLVMSVFTLPASNLVFKVIRDRFGAPKETSPEQVREHYRLVFRLDRVGRLVDAQEFENLEFPRARFSDEVLRELLSETASSVKIDGEHVVVRHVYTERRLRPLDLYLQEAAEADAVAAVVEYGQAIKDLACADIFPGDLLIKNFGVSRHGRVIFYDYDELTLLTRVRFRALPTARYDDEELSADPWFAVDERDVFPEEFLPFLLPPGTLRDAFLAVHADLLTPQFWREMQQRQQAGEVPDFFPYPPQRRLHPRATST